MILITDCQWHCSYPTLAKLTRSILGENSLDLSDIHYRFQQNKPWRKTSSCFCFFFLSSSSSLELTGPFHTRCRNTDFSTPSQTSSLLFKEMFVLSETIWYVCEYLAIFCQTLCLTILFWLFFFLFILLLLSFPEHQWVTANLSVQEPEN